MPDGRVVPQTRSVFPATLVLISLLAVFAGISFFFDAPLDHWVAEHRHPAWQTAAKMISRYCAWHWLMGAAALCLAISWLRRRRDWVRILIAMMIASSIAGLSADCLRGITGRTRPYAPVAQGWYGMHRGSEWLVGRHAYNSFPSGHSAAAVAFAVPLLFSRRWSGLLALSGALIVGGSRICLSAHHLSDVMVGAMLGAATASWVWYRLIDKVCRRNAGALKVEAPDSQLR